MKYSSIIGLVAFFGLIFGYNGVIAAPMMYTFSGEESGTFGGVAFNNATVTITLFGDTANVTTNAAYIVNARGYDLSAALLTTSASVSVDGIGTGTILDPILLYRDYETWVPANMSATISINDAANSDQLIWGFNGNGDLATYSFGSMPLMTDLYFAWGVGIDEATTFGDFVSPWPGIVTNGSFEAAAVPEPLSTLLLGGCLMFAALFRHRSLLVS